MTRPLIYVLFALAIVLIASLEVRAQGYDCEGAARYTSWCSETPSTWYIEPGHFRDPNIYTDDGVNLARRHLEELERLRELEFQNWLLQQYDSNHQYHEEWRYDRY